MAVNVPLLRFSELSETNAVSDSDYMIVFDAADQKKIKWTELINQLNGRLKTKEVTGTTDLGGNLQIVTDGAIYAVFPAGQDLKINYIFTNTYGTPYINVSRWSTGQIIAQGSCKVRVIYK